MIKKSLVLLPLLVGLCSCVNEKEIVYTNVPYEFDLSQRVYVVSLYEEDKLVNEWKVKPEYVYFINVTKYDYKEYRTIDSEFYVKGNSYKLYVFNYL